MPTTEIITIQIRDGRNGRADRRVPFQGPRLKGRKSAQKYAEKKAQQWELQLKPYADMEKRHATELEQSEERVKQVKAAATKAYKDLKGAKKEREALVAKLGPASG